MYRAISSKCDTFNKLRKLLNHVHFLLIFNKPNTHLNFEFSVVKLFS